MMMMMMTCRGLVHNMWVGVLIALPSGAGVALAILAGNTESLVGVAISAALLEPAVNAVCTALYAIAVTTVRKRTKRSLQSSKVTTIRHVNLVKSTSIVYSVLEASFIHSYSFIPFNSGSKAHKTTDKRNDNIIIFILPVGENCKRS